MARTTSARIIEWGTPPEPEPTGWDAVRIELGRKPGEWANVGEYNAGSARRIAAEKLPADAYETRLVPVKGTPSRVQVWVRAHEPATPTAADDAAAAIVADAMQAAIAETDAPAKATRTAKRGAVV